MAVVSFPDVDTLLDNLATTLSGLEEPTDDEVDLQRLVADAIALGSAD